MERCAGPGSVWMPSFACFSTQQTTLIVLNEMFEDDLDEVTAGQGAVCPRDECAPHRSCA